MDPEPWTWHWGTFFIYCVACFFVSLVMGMLGVPGIFVVAVGVALGLWAALRRWFEIPLVPGGVFADRKPG
jgi:hypothetical protein